MPVTRKVPNSLSPARWIRASENRASRGARLLSAKCSRSASLPFSTRPAGWPPALRRHSKSSVTQAAISSTSALLKALPKRRNSSSMASAMILPSGGGEAGQPVVKLGPDLGPAEVGDLVALLAPVRCQHVDRPGRDIAGELERRGGGIGGGARRPDRHRQRRPAVGRQA